MATCMNVPHINSWNDSGVLLASGKLELYEVGTSTPKVAYKNAAGTTSYGSTINLDASGRPDDGEIYWDGQYKVEIYEWTNGAHALIHTIDSYGEPDGVTAVSTGGKGMFNGSFEVDSDSDGDPDYWTITDSGSVVSLATDTPWHGGQYLKFTNSAASADTAVSNFYEISEDKRLLVGFALKASNANAEPTVQVQWFDKSQASVSTSTVFDGTATDAPTSWTDYYNLSVEAPATAAYYKIKIIGNENATQYTTCFDDVRTEQTFNLPIPAPYTIFGMNISNDGTDADHDLVITAGACKAYPYTGGDIILPSDITKQLDASWAAGTNAGGLSSGTSIPVSGFLYIHVVADTNTGAVDVIFDDSLTSPSLPSGYDIFRCIGAWRTDASSNWDGGRHYGDHFDFNTRIEEVNDSSITNSVAETGTATAPPNSTLKCIGHANCSGSWGGDLGWGLSHPDFTFNAFHLYHFFGFQTLSEADENYGIAEVLLDGSSQFEYYVRGVGTNSFDLHSHGFIFHERSNPQS